MRTVTPSTDFIQVELRFPNSIHSEGACHEQQSATVSYRNSGDLGPLADIANYADAQLGLVHCRLGSGRSLSVDPDRTASAMGREPRQPGATLAARAHESTLGGSDVVWPDGRVYLALAQYWPTTNSGD